MKQKRKLPGEQKFGIALLLLIVPLLLFSGCMGERTAVAPAEARVASAETDPMEEVVPLDPEEALDEIYADVDVRGVEEVSPQVLFEKFGIAEELYTDYYVRCSSGRYGLADVFIIEPAYGREEELREALEQLKTNRIVEFRNYDIYNALEYAENGQIFQAGPYYVLVMLENADQAREIIERCVPVEE